MICLSCLHEFPDEEMIFIYAIVNTQKPQKKPKPHSGLCPDCYKNPDKYPKGIN